MRTSSDREVTPASSRSVEHLLAAMAVGGSDEAAASVDRASSQSTSSARQPSALSPRAGGVARIVVEFTRLPLNMVLLRNEETRLIEVMQASGQASAKGVCVGDVVVALNGQRVKPGLHHDKLKQFIGNALKAPPGTGTGTHRSVAA